MPNNAVEVLENCKVATKTSTLPPLIMHDKLYKIHCFSNTIFLNNEPAQPGRQ